MAIKFTNCQLSGKLFLSASQHCGKLCLWYFLISAYGYFPSKGDVILYVYIAMFSFNSKWYPECCVYAHVLIVYLYDLLFSIISLVHVSDVHSPTTSRCTKWTFRDPGYVISIMQWPILSSSFFYFWDRRVTEIERNTRWKVLNIINEHIAILFDW